MRSGSVTFWAWMVSIAVHLIVFLTFSVAKLSKSPVPAAQGPVPMATVSQVKKLIYASSVTPKPKIKKFVKGRRELSTNNILPTSKVFATPKPGTQDRINLIKPPDSIGSRTLTSSKAVVQGIEFFGSHSDRRKVCYVVDCSGSMKGLFGRVRTQLKDSISRLQPDQYFDIIFFGNDRLFEFGDGQLTRATQKAKSAACEFIDRVEPAGQTNATAALERAMQIRNGDNHGPAVIYFLTDGFELSIEDAYRFGRKITALWQRSETATTVNTIGFYPTGDDIEALKMIARESGGEFILITDR